MVGKVETLAIKSISSTLNDNFPSCGTSETEGSSSARVFNFAINDEIKTLGIVPLTLISPLSLKFTANPESSC